MAQHYFLPAATTIVFLLFLSPPTTTAKTTNLVVDSDGKPLVPGEFYYVIPKIITPKGGGLSTIPVGSPACPGYFLVSQLMTLNDPGIPVAFFPKNPTDIYVTIASDINVVNQHFYTPSKYICLKYYSTVWSLQPRSYALGGEDLTLGGVRGEPKAYRSWFQIEKNDNELVGGYKIVFRPSPTIRDVVPGDLNVVTKEDGQGVLGLDTSGNALVFEFIKATPTETDATM